MGWRDSNDLEALKKKFVAFLDEQLARAPKSMKAFNFNWDVSIYGQRERVAGGLYGFKSAAPKDLGAWDWESIDGNAEPGEDDDETTWAPPGEFIGPEYAMKTPDYLEWCEGLTKWMHEIVHHGVEHSKVLAKIGKPLSWNEHDGEVVWWRPEKR